MGYEAIVGFAVGQKADSNAWETLVNVALETYSSVYDMGLPLTQAMQDAADKVENALKSMEEEYKAELSETALPSTYRSAKSVVLKALRHNVALRTDLGTIKGKTAVEKECKGTPAEKDILDYVDALIKRLDKEKDADKLLVALSNLKEYVDAHITS